MSHFFLDYLKNLYREFDGDLALVIVLAEIAHHSTSGCFTPGPGSGPAMRPPAADGLSSCSAYSLAAATGLPRETVRRKIARLSDRGWVEKAGRAEVRLTAKVAEHFTPDFNIRLLDRLLETSDRIRGVLASE
jgi:DNA-binding transcriptional ArsR family regulator